MSTVKELEAIQKQLEKEREEISNAYLNNQSYIQAKIVFDKAQENLENMRRLVMDQQKPKIQEIEEKQRKLWEELIEARKEEKKQKADQYGDNVYKIIGLMSSGVNWGPKGLVPVWISEDKRFFILRIPGHTFWASMTEPNKYAPTNHMLIDSVKFWEETKANSNTLTKGRIMGTEGRLTKTMMKEFEDRIEIARKENPTNE